MITVKKEKAFLNSSAGKDVPWRSFLFLIAISLGIHFFRVGWGDFYRLGLFQVMEDDHLSSYCLYWSNPAVFQNDVIRERALTMTAGSIQRWLPVLLGGFPSPNFWSQGWALFQEVGITAGVFWLGWLATRQISVSVLSSLMATAANPSGWNWAVFSGGFLFDYPASAAFVAALLGYGFLLKRRWRWVPAVSLFCALLHPSIGLWNSLIQVIWIWYQAKSNRSWLIPSVLAGPILVAAGQLVVGSFSPVTDLIQGSQFQDFCRLNWHLQPWWEPSSGVLLARFVNGFLPCFFLVSAAMADRKFSGTLSLGYFHLVRLLTLASWAGFFLGVAFFYTANPSLILSSPVRIGAVWAYACLPVLGAYFFWLATHSRFLDSVLFLLALAGLLAWDTNVFLRYPSLLCAFLAWVRQLRLSGQLTNFATLASLFACWTWLLVFFLAVLILLFPKIEAQAFFFISSVRPGWTEASWKGVLAPLQSPGTVFFYGMILLIFSLFFSRSISKKILVRCFGLLLGILLLKGAWNERLARALVVTQGTEILDLGQTVHQDRSGILTNENRSLRFLLQRPIALLGFYNSNIYARSVQTQQKQLMFFKVLNISFPQKNSDLSKSTTYLAARVRRISSPDKQVLAKLSGMHYLLLVPTAIHRKGREEAHPCPANQAYRLIWLGKS